jgi:hypothetical protein
LPHFAWFRLRSPAARKSSNSSGNAQLRILNAFSEAPALDVPTVASKPGRAALPFQGLTQYTSIDTGTPMFTVGSPARRRP